LQCARVGRDAGGGWDCHSAGLPPYDRDRVARCGGGCEGPGIIRGASIGGGFKFLFAAVSLCAFTCCERVQPGARLPVAAAMLRCCGRPDSDGQPGPKRACETALAGPGQNGPAAKNPRVERGGGHQSIERGDWGGSVKQILLVANRADGAESDVIHELESKVPNTHHPRTRNLHLDPREGALGYNENIKVFWICG
jgi:hypothetical protein